MKTKKTSLPNPSKLLVFTLLKQTLSSPKAIKPIFEKNEASEKAVFVPSGLRLSVIKRLPFLFLKADKDSRSNYPIFLTLVTSDNPKSRKKLGEQKAARRKYDLELAIPDVLIEKRRLSM